MPYSVTKVNPWTGVPYMHTNQMGGHSFSISALIHLWKN